MPLSAGDKLGQYNVLSLLGKGGMGEVYRALDTQLKREVALKVLPAAFSADPERLARFQREAELLASLDHPNIGHIYGMVQAERNWALVLALIEGPTLADRIAQGPVPADEAIALSKQIIDALEYAHERGVIHRDLKPANIKVTPDGVVKVLDFGLAKALDQRAGSTSLDPENSPTLTMGATQAGVIMGTAAYMSPEQAVGKPADRRSDIFSFGVVLYEMLTGQRSFRGESMGDTLAAVVKDAPDWSALPSATPSHLRTLLQRMLAKDRKQRLQVIGEARLILEAGEPAAAPVRSESGAPRKFLWSTVIVAAVALFAAAGVSYVHFRETASVLPPGRFNVALPSNLGFLELSPDGGTLSFVSSEGGQPRIWVRPLDVLEARQIPGTEGASFPFWSPDGENLGFFADGKLKKIAVAGGPAQTLCDAPTARGGTWNREGVIVFAPNIEGSLFRVSADGGTPAQLTKFGRYPEFILGGKRFLFEGGSGQAETTGIFAGSLDGSSPVRILPDDSRALYTPLPAGEAAGHLLFRREGTLMALPFDAEKLSTTGSAIPLAENVPEAGTNGYGGFAASGNGVLLYRSGAQTSNVKLAWLDRSGKRLDVKGEARDYVSLALSPDGKRAATIISAGTLAGAGDVWLQDLERGVATKFTFRAGMRFPVWSPDGKFIVFTDAPNIGGLYRKPSDGGGVEELLLPKGGNNTVPTEVSPDGKWLVYSHTEGKTKDDLLLLPLTGERKPVVYVDSPFTELHGQFSPDGKWMAYTSDESGRNEVYVQPIPATGAKRQVSTNGGARPRWRRDGKELFYISAESKLMAVPAKLGPSGYDFAAPQQLFDKVLALVGNAREFGYQPAADGQRFLMLLPEEGAASTAPAATIRINWQAGLKK